MTFQRISPPFCSLPVCPITKKDRAGWVPSFLTGILLFSLGALEAIAFSDDGLSAHVRTKRFRNDDGAVCLLVVFHDGSHRTAYSETGAVQGMNEFRLVSRMAAEADIGARAWKSRQLEQEEISLYLFWAGIHTSRS